MRSMLLALAAGTALVATPVLAQSTNTAPATSTTTAPANAAAGSAATATSGVTVSQSDAMVSNLIDLDVMNANNEDVGEIEDIILDGNMGFKGYVISVGGFLGVGDRYVVVAPDAIDVTFDSNANEWKAKTSLNRDQLGAMPEFKYEGKFED